MALANDDDVAVMHPSDNGGHRWKLNRQEKTKLLNHIRRSIRSRKNLGVGIHKLADTERGTLLFKAAPAHCRL
jgi:hypothetical protein